MGTYSVGIGSSAATNVDYDSEYHFGVVPADPSDPSGGESAAEANANALTSALQAQFEGGNFDFPCGPSGPVLGCIVLPAKEVFTRGIVKTAKRWGMRLRGTGPRSWQFPSASNNIGLSTRLTRIDGENGGAVIRLRGTASELQRISFSGREYYTDSTGEGPDGPGAVPSGTRVPIGIELEGSNPPPSGLQVIRDCAVWSCGVAIYQRRGYYGYHVGTVAVSGTAVTGSGSPAWMTAGAAAGMRIGFGSTDPFAITTWYTISSVNSNTSITLSSSAGSISSGSSYVIDELFVDLGSGANGDNNAVENFLAMDCDTVFKTDNVQAVEWSFHNLFIECWGGAGARPVVVFDIVKGDCITCDGCISLNNPSATVVQVTENDAQRVECYGVRWDHGGSPDYLTLFKYAGDVISDMSSYQFSVRMTGKLPVFSPPYDIWKLIDIPQATAQPVYRFPTKDLIFDLTNLPTDGFIKVGEGPWWRPGPDYSCDLRARWKLDDGSGTTATDISNNGLDGTLSSSPAPSWTTGKVGGALSFANDASNVIVADNSALHLQNTSTVAFWVYINSYVNGTILSKFGTTGNLPRGFRTEASGSKFLVTDDAVNKFDIGTYVTSGIWHHIAVTINDGGVMTCYVDGVDRGTANLGDSWFNNTNALRFGAPQATFYGSLTNSFNGVLDDVRFYGANLSADEVNDIYIWRPQ